MKAGRNEPCPCGSGKKYKKCCLEKDEQIVLDEVVKKFSNYKPEVDEWEPEDNLWNDNHEPIEEDDFEEEEDKEEEEDDFEEEEDEEGDIFGSLFGYSSETDDNDEVLETLPEISGEEIKLVDDWYVKLKQLKDTVKEREHLLSFINLYPHLVDHLELYLGVLFEIGAGHYRKGIFDEFVELLLKIREEYPRTYKESFEYYDSDLIYWFTAKGRLDEIDKFFNYFREKGKISEELENLIDFFHAINRSDIIFTTFAGTKIREYISWIISNNVIQRYFDKPVTDETVNSMMDELAKERVLDEDDTIDKFKELLFDYIRPFTPWDELPMKRSQAYVFYTKRVRNFTYFMYKNLELSFSSAIIFSNFIYEYYNRIIEQKKRPADIYCLDEKTITKFSIKCYDTVLWGYKMQCCMALNAFYWFTDYLKICGNISEEQKNSVQEMLTNIYQKVYEMSKNQGPEMLSFVQFPLWTIKM
jgi:hypothetical protein